MKVLLTGACGFIGNIIFELLIKEGYDVVGLDIKESGNKKIINGSICDYNFMNELFFVHKFDIVCHQAALISVPQSIDDPLLTYSSNVSGTLNIFELSRKFNIKKVIYASSFNAKYKETSPYACSKKINEIYGKLYYNIYGIPTIGLRYTNVYGTTQKTNGKYGNVIPIFENNISKDIPIIIYGDGEQTRDFIHVDDVAKANLLTIKCNNFDIYGKILNIGTGNSITINNLAKIIYKKYKKSPNIMYQQNRSGDLKHISIDPLETFCLLKFKSKIDISK